MVSGGVFRRAVCIVSHSLFLLQGSTIREALNGQPEPFQSEPVHPFAAARRSDEACQFFGSLPSFRRLLCVNRFPQIGTA